MSTSPQETTETTSGGGGPASVKLPDQTVGYGPAELEEARARAAAAAAGAGTGVSAGASEPVSGARVNKRALVGLGALTLVFVFAGVYFSTSSSREDSAAEAYEAERLKREARINQKPLAGSAVDQALERQTRKPEKLDDALATLDAKAQAPEAFPFEQAAELDAKLQAFDDKASPFGKDGDAKEEEDKNDPWVKAREQARAANAQAHFQEAAGARRASLFFASGKKQDDEASDDERAREEQPYDSARERAKFEEKLATVRAMHEGSASPQPMMAMGLPGGQASQSAPGGYEQMNAQAQKRAFMRDPQASAPGGAPSWVSDARLVPIRSQAEIPAGTQLMLVLETQINSDLPGPVKARVASPVYDRRGEQVLVAAGAVVLGEYSSSVSFGQNRVQVAWQLLRLTDGRTIDLGRAPGLDLSGQSGYADQVDEHWDQVIGGALIASVLNASSAAAQGQTSALASTPSQRALSGASEPVTNVGNAIVQRNLDVQPTIVIRAGSRVTAMIMRDLWLE